MDSLAERRAIVEQGAAARLVDQGDARRTGVIARVEVPARVNRRAIGREPAGRDEIERDLASDVRPPAARVRQQPASTSPKRRPDRPGRVDDAGDCRHRGEGTLVHLHGSGAPWNRAGAHGHDEQAIRLEAEQHLCKPAGGPHEQTRGRHEHDRQRNLCRDQSARQQARASGGTPSFILQRLDGRHTRRMQSRHRSEEHDGNPGYADRECQHAPVDREIDQDGAVGSRKQSHERPAGPRGQQRPGEGAGAPQRQGFDEQRPRQAPPRRAQREPYAQFAPPRCGARQEQARDVQADDQEHDARDDREDDEGVLV